MKLDALRGEVADDVEQTFELGAAKHGRGLVEDDQPRVARQGAGDLHHLALRNAEAVEPGAGVDVEAEPRHDVSRLLRCAAGQSTRP